MVSLIASSPAPSPSSVRRAYAHLDVCFCVLGKGTKYKKMLESRSEDVLVLLVKLVKSTHTAHSARTTHSACSACTSCTVRTAQTARTAHTAD